MPWQMLQVSDAIDREFLSALNSLVPTIGWKPRMSALGMFQNDEQEVLQPDPPELIRFFPLQKGYYKEPLASILKPGIKQVQRMLRYTDDPKNTPLVCTTPYWADAAQAWQGPVVYYLTDLMFAYHGVHPPLIRKLDIAMCKAATLVCPNSRSIKEYLIKEAGCDPDKIQIIPNATRQANLFDAPPTAPGPLPADIADLPRPIAGVIGNLAGNMDWKLLTEVVARTPDFSWAFVGPVDMQIEDPEHRNLRAAMIQAASEKYAGRIKFVGGKPYGQLASYARSFDVAVLPYEKREPTLSGSSTRFYEHLAACRPMLATYGFRELYTKEPLLRLVENADETVSNLLQLRDMKFNDGHLEDRWLASRNGTWHCRAAQVIESLTERCGIDYSKPHLSQAAATSYSQQTFALGGQA